MSAKDTIVKVLQKNTRYVTQDDISSSPFVKTPEAIFEEDISDVADQILDSLPKLDNKEVANILDDMQGEVRIGRAGYFKKAVNQICSLVPEPKQMRSMTKEEIKKEEEYDRKHYQVYDLVPEHKWVQTTDDKGNVIVSLGEVVATGEVKDDAFEYAGGYKIGGKDIDSFFYEHHNQSGTLVWVPDKEDK